jgi:hypothetical protein
MIHGVIPMGSLLQSAPRKDPRGPRGIRVLRDEGCRPGDGKGRAAFAPTPVVGTEPAAARRTLEPPGTRSQSVIWEAQRRPRNRNRPPPRWEDGHGPGTVARPGKAPGTVRSGQGADRQVQGRLTAPWAAPACVGFVFWSRLDSRGTASVRGGRTSQMAVSGSSYAGPRSWEPRTTRSVYVTAMRWSPYRASRACSDRGYRTTGSRCPRSRG